MSLVDKNIFLFDKKLPEEAGGQLPFYRIA
jgi:hypothetical protein